MLESIQHWATVAGDWGPTGFFIATLLAEMGFPIPSSIFPIVAALMVELPNFDGIGRALGLVLLPAVLGNIVGAFLLYAVAYYGGKPAIVRWGKWIGVSWDKVEQVQEKLRGTNIDEALVFLSICIPLVPASPLIALAGIIRMNVRTYALLVVGSTLVRFVGIFLLAFLFGHTITHLI
jgi:membrane protein DedA with SNARE-associated domain